MKDLTMFSLDGTFLTPPKLAKASKPTWIITCQSGKFLHSLIDVGTVLDSTNIYPRMGLPSWSDQDKTKIMIQLDNEEKPQLEYWGHSDDYSTIYLNTAQAPIMRKVSNTGEKRLKELFYGHVKNGQVHKIVIMVPEYLGALVSMRFDLPDVTAVADSCGLVEHKK